MMEITQLMTIQTDEPCPDYKVTIECDVFGDDAVNELDQIRQFIYNRATVEIREKTKQGSEAVRTRKAVREAIDSLVHDLCDRDPLVTMLVGEWADTHYPVLKTPEQIGAEVLEKINAAESIEEAMNACKEGFKAYRKAWKRLEK